MKAVAFIQGVGRLKKVADGAITKNYSISQWRNHGIDMYQRIYHKKNEEQNSEDLILTQIKQDQKTYKKCE